MLSAILSSTAGVVGAFMPEYFSYAFVRFFKLSFQPLHRQRFSSETRKMLYGEVVETKFWQILKMLDSLNAM